MRTRAPRAILILLLAASACLGVIAPGRASAQDFFWESPRALADSSGSFPTLLQLKDEIVSIWQESESTPNGSEDHGQAWLSLARLSGGEWQVKRRFAGPFDFRGTEPSVYSATGEGSRIAIAAANGDGEIEVLVSRDGGQSFEVSARPAPSSAAVAPRIFLSAGGGYILFVTQGSNENLNLYHSTSPDGLSWKPFQPFIADAEGLSLNFLPTAGRLDTKDGPRDIVVFQSLLTSARPTFQLYAKTSADGGLTWSKATRLTSFIDPVVKEKPEPDNFDNERPNLGTAGGKLWLAWERRSLGGTPQIYAAPLVLDAAGTPSVRLPETDLVSTGSGSGSCSAPQLLELGGGAAVVWFDNRKGTNRVYLAQRQGIDWVETDLSGSSRGDASFGRVAVAGGKPYAVWQTTVGERTRIYVLEPDTRASAPVLTAQDFSPGKRTRRELATVRVDQSFDSSGIEGYSWIWTRDPKAEPPHAQMAQSTQRTVQGKADADGSWYFAVSAVDYAGNWSAPTRIRFERDTTPPAPPLILPAPLDEEGYLSSNSFGLDWLVPDSPEGQPADDVAGYSWELRYIGALEKQPLKAAAILAAQAKAAAEGSPILAPTAPRLQPVFALPGLDAYEAALVSRSGPPLLPQAILGDRTRASWNNVDDGYYLFSVSAVDGTGNIGQPSSILIRANKFVPYTSVTYADSSRDDFGKSWLTIRGRGFSIDGPIDRIVIDRDGREPYDLDKQHNLGGFRIASDREINGLAFEDMAAGNYRIGLYHPTRGWYWTGPVLAIDISGTLKFGGEGSPYVPSWKLLSPKARPVSVYDIIVAMAVLFAGLGIFLSARQTAVAAREIESVHLEVLALVSGGPMPTAAKVTKARKLRKRGAGLRLKITLTIASLVVFIVTLVAILLGKSMIDSESETLGRGLEQRALVLLESVSQGARSYLPAENLLELGFLPQQASALEDAVYITVTGFGSGSTTDSDVVWASNDPDILRKIDTATLQPGVSRLTDSLSPKLPIIVKELNDRAAVEVGARNAALAAMTQEGRSLATKLDAASQKRLAEISSSSRDYEKEITEKLSALAQTALSSTPAFDPKLATQADSRYLFYKPVMFRRGQDQLYYRGMVRLEVSTEKIVQSVRDETWKLITRAFYIALAALGLGIVGAIVLSSIIVVPIKKLVKAIETIRDTEDKEELENLKIEVASRDEIFTLADSVNQMTAGLVKAAKASKELVVGKGIQKMFIPLDPAPGTSGKFSTGHRSEKDFEVFGYYEGADAVSGDYWDFRSINSRYHYFIKCDVSGHGVSAALIMVQVATMVINYFNEWKQAMPKKIDLTEITYRINDFLEERQFKGRFAAFTLGVWDSQQGLAYLCEAGDRKLHIWNAAEGRLVEETLPDSPAAGPLPSFMIQMKQPFMQVTRQLARGDILLLYTDGLDEANHHFRDRDFRPMRCTDVADNADHTVHHKGGQENEEFGYDRICAILEAIDARGGYRLAREHVPDPNEVLSFDFSGCDGSLEEKAIALFSVEKVFRMYRDPAATDKDSIVVDAKVDEFLRKKRHFDQIRLFLGPDKEDGSNPNVVPLADTNNPGYVLYKGLKEDPQDDDLTFLGIMRK